MNSRDSGVWCTVGAPYIRRIKRERERSSASRKGLAGVGEKGG